MPIYKHIKQLEVLLSDMAFQVSQNAPAKEIHSQIVQALVVVDKLKTLKGGVSSSDNTEQAQTAEINKVQRRLRLWAKRHNQINHKILVAFLRLRNTGQETITESDLRKSLDDADTFDTNFVQMKNISEKNHGKIFEQLGERVVIWPPVEKYVIEFEEMVRAYNEK
jgi:hypothetical protein